MIQFRKIYSKLLRNEAPLITKVKDRQINNVLELENCLK